MRSPRPIASHPRARLALLARGPSAAMDRALDGLRLYRYSRDGLHAVFAALGAPHGTPVWMPAFHCGLEVRNAADAGFAPRFYRVGADLAVDEEDLARGLRDAPGPVLLIHYFGFAQPGIARIAALCEAAGVPLIEDCAHAILSAFDGRALGTFGSAATYSLYKTFGTADGGALRADTAALARITGRSVGLPALQRRPPVAWEAERDVVRRRRRDAPVRGRDPARVRAVLAERFSDRVVAAEQRIFEGELRYGRAISQLSLALLRRCDPDLAADRRRANYHRLDALLRPGPGYRPAYDALPGGACPLYLPVFVRDRTTLLLRLQAARIEPFIFGMFHHPALAAHRFPDSRRLRENVLCLPVHQGLRARDAERLAAVLRPLLADDARA